MSPPKQSTCRSCGNQIIWYLKVPPHGKNIPVDADSVEAGDHEYDKDNHVVHFDTCKSDQRYKGKYGNDQG